MTERRLFIFGLGYVGEAVASAAHARGWTVAGTHRGVDKTSADPERGIRRLRFGALEDVWAGGLREATHLLVSVPPGADDDPALRAYGERIARGVDAMRAQGAAPALRWIGYYSTTGVYGDRSGGVVNERTRPLPGQPRSMARLRAEQGWLALARRLEIACDIIRLGGIYGPGHSAFDALRQNRARTIIAPEHLFSRIHRDDAAEATLAAIDTAAGPPSPEGRILNFVDSQPSTQADVVRYAAALLGMNPPAPVPLAAVLPEMSPMAASFWCERRIVRSTLTEECLGRPWRYADYRTGLAAVLKAERDGLADIPVLR